MVRKGFTLVETLVAVVIVGLLIALAAGVVLGAARVSKEKAIRENLQIIWKTANIRFVEEEKTELSVSDLMKAGSAGKTLPDLSPVDGEDYTTVNGGKITVNDKKLEISFGDAGKKVVYETE